MHSHRELVHRCIDWDRIRSRLSRYPNIARHFPEHVLRCCSDSPPYYCHYMAWRLGTWPTETYAEKIEHLLSIASSLNNWKQEFRSRQQKCDFGEFWGLVWQMQVAEFFGAQGAGLTWNPAGPDLTAEDSDGRFYVECYAYQKSYPIEVFIREVLSCVDKRIRVHHRSYLPFSLPKNADTAGFLDELLRPYLDPRFADQEIEAADQCWPHLLPVPSGAENLFIYIEGPSDAYQPGVLPNSAGDPSSYLRDCISKAIGNKQDANKLATHRPNLLAVNYLLGGEFSPAEQRRMQLGEKFVEPDLGPGLDAVMFSATGIDQELSQFTVVSQEDVSPAVAWLQRKRLIDSRLAG